MAKSTPFGLAFAKAREATGLSQTQIAHTLGRLPNTVYRWEKRDSVPSMELRIGLLHALAKAPRPLLEELAAESGVSLASIGLGPPPAVLPPAPTGPVQPTSPAPIPATAQATVDDAVREAAEEIDVTPKLLRPALSRMLDRLARGGVPMDAAARMVLGVPKKEGAK